MPTDPTGCLGILVDFYEPTALRVHRSERAIRVFRKIGLALKPARPDFSYIYAHALADVRKDKDKPQYVVSVFRDKHVMRAFEDTWRTKDQTRLDTEFDKLITRKVEAGDSRYTEVDSRAEILEFTNVFRGLVDETRTPAEAELYNIVNEVLKSVALKSADMSKYPKLSEATASQSAKDTIQSIEDRRSVLLASSLQNARGTDHAKDLETLIRGVVHSLAYESVQEEQVNRYYSNWVGMNRLVKVTLSILDGTKIPVQVNYGILRRLDYDSLHLQSRTLVMDSFNAEYAVVQIERAVLSTIDVQAIVMALESYIEMRRSESDGQFSIADLSDEIGEVLIPFINEEELRSVIEQAALTSLPNYAILGRQVYELCGSAIIAAAHRL